MMIDPFLHAWDERFHILVAKNTLNHILKPTLYENPILPYDYKNWVGNHIWVHKQPFPIWLMSIASAFSGNTEWVYRIPTMILSTTGVYFTYLIGKKLFNRNVAFIAAGLHSIHGLILEVSAGRVTTDHYDAQYLVLIEIAIYFAISNSKKSFKNEIIAGIFMGLAILTKWLPALIVVPIYLISQYDKKSALDLIKGLITIVISGITIALPWQVYSLINYPLETKWEQLFNSKHLTEVIEGHTAPFFYHFDKMRMLYGELIYIPLIWLIGDGIKNIRNWKSNISIYIISTWIIIPFVFFSIAKTKMQGYTLLTAPAIFLMTGYFFWRLIELTRIEKNKFKRIGYQIIALLLIALPVRYSVERIKPFNNPHLEPLWSKQVKSLTKVTSPSSDNVILNAEHYIETMFYTECTAYENIPSQNDLNLILSKANKVYVIDDNHLPNYIIENPNIEIIKYQCD